MAETFGEHYLGEVDKKYYIEAPENGEMLQIAISMTCPKTQIEVSSRPAIRGGGMDFESESVFVSSGTKEITPEERETVAEMMRRLGL